MILLFNEKEWWKNSYGWKKYRGEMSVFICVWINNVVSFSNINTITHFLPYILVVTGQSASTKLHLEIPLDISLNYIITYLQQEKKKKTKQANPRAFSPGNQMASYSHQYPCLLKPVCFLLVHVASVPASLVLPSLGVQDFPTQGLVQS